MRVRLLVVTILGLGNCGPIQAQGLRTAAFLPRDMKYVEVFADGNLKDAIAQDRSVQMASGSVGVTYATDRTLASFLINAVGTASPLTENFGSSLLAPASGGSLSAGMIDVTFRPFLRYRKPERGDQNASEPGGLARRLATRWYLSISSAKWTDVTASEENEAELPVIGAVAAGMGTGIRYFFVSGFLNDRNRDLPRPENVGDLAGLNPVAVYFDLGPVMRWLGGDIGSDTNSTVRRALFGPGRRTRVGLEAGLGIQYQGMKAGLTYYWFDGENSGFSDGQVIAGFSVQTALMRGFVLGGSERSPPGFVR